MLFQQGDHVVYPGYGAGTIIAIENREFTGTTTRYYMLTMVAKEGEFMVPIDSADSLGIRRVVEREAIWAVLRASAGDLPGDYKERQAGISQLLSTSHALSMSQGSRDLARFAGFRSLTGRDVKSLSLRKASRVGSARGKVRLRSNQLESRLQPLDQPFPVQVCLVPPFPRRPPP